MQKKRFSCCVMRSHCGGIYGKNEKADHGRIEICDAYVLARRYGYDDRMDQVGYEDQTARFGAVFL